MFKNNIDFDVVSYDILYLADRYKTRSYIKEGRISMDLVSISEVSKNCKVSTRTLRYYEKIGLLNSRRKEGYAYRVYDEETVLRIQQIIVLRKLQIPLKQISRIINDESAKTTIEILNENINIMTNKITSLSIIKELVLDIIKEIEKNQNINIPIDILNNDSIINEITLSSFPYNSKGEKIMKNLNRANEELDGIKSARIIHLPAGTVASSHYIGENPEDHAVGQLKRFLEESKLYEIKPDARVFGFNHPNPSADRPYGYEIWVTIPKDMDVPDYLEKKHFDGGLYAAHSIAMGNFNEWKWLSDWVDNDNAKYESNMIDDNGEVMGGLLEEHLNYVYYSHNEWPSVEEQQLDLLYPIKLKK